MSEPQSAGAPSARRRLALRVSAALIVADWSWEIARHVLVPEADRVPGSVAEIARFVALKGVLCVVLVAALLRWAGDGAGAIGLRRAGLAGQLLRGAGFGVLLFVLGNVGLNALLHALLPADSGGERLAPLFAHRSELPLWIFCAVVGGGVIEELVRVFVLTRWQAVGGRAGLVAALLIDTTVFGLGHLYQGAGGALLCGFAGLGYALVFLRRRSALEAMAAHAVFDVIGVVAAYALYAPK